MEMTQRFCLYTGSCILCNLNKLSRKVLIFEEVFTFWAFMLQPDKYHNNPRTRPQFTNTEHRTQFECCCINSCPCVGILLLEFSFNTQTQSN